MSQGISILEVPEKELQIVEKFPNIKKSIEQNQILQIYKEGYGFYAIIENHHDEGPYAEQEYLEVIAEEKQEDLLETLIQLDQKIANDSLNLSPKKAYRYYGMEKYR